MNKDRKRSWSPLLIFRNRSTKSKTAEEAAAELDRLRRELEVASDKILSMYRTWVADDYEAMPPKNSLPGKAYYAARAALRAEEEG